MFDSVKYCVIYLRMLGDFWANCIVSMRDYERIRKVFTVAVSKDDDKVIGFHNIELFAFYTKAFDHVAIIDTFVSNESRGQGVSKKLFQSTLMKH